MRLHGSDIECLADQYAPVSGVFLVNDYSAPVSPSLLLWDVQREQRRHPGRQFVVASPSAWAEVGAFNVARAYKPEGVA